MRPTQLPAMENVRFFRPVCSLQLGEVARISGSQLVRGEADAVITNCAAADTATSGDLTFLDSSRYLHALKSSRAAACLCREHHVDTVPGAIAVLVTDQPSAAYARVVRHLYPDAIAPRGFYDLAGSEFSIDGIVHPTATIEDSVRIEPGAVVGAGAIIGRGTVICASCVVGSGVSIGRDCVIGANTTVQCSIIGDRVIIHPGVCIGQDGFGFQSSAAGHDKTPQIGRVIIQDDVEIGAGCTVDRGANRDTIIGEGSKLDNQVQIGHNVVVGRHCLLVSQVGISGSSTLGDFVAIGGQSGVNGHVHIGDGAQIAAVSTVHGDVPAGARWGGTPARPVKEWLREITMLRRMAKPNYPAQKSKDAQQVGGQGGKE